ncbi:hypothetical protein C0Q70_02934 [Pomacea canaliculata]|uniref:Fibrinogen C-terminal domain-containing protein n=1 Tax=Pomacea canaliculata TaxID=400727 RepID=A0A2T7PRC3_POMCA|nr:uncharacterized protein LOC112557345 [Pomacea canaliculata]PVD35965.1 hypothetical protein C0Q70_02934 [Pomacea canaliculata]
MFRFVSSLLLLSLLTLVKTNEDTSTTKLRTLIEQLQQEVVEIKNQVSSASRCSCQEFIEEDGYILAFRMVAGIGDKGYSVFVDENRDDDLPLVRAVTPCECRSNLTDCNRHYRGSILRYWSRLAIQTVKLVVYKEGQAKQYVVFNGTGSTYSNWMSPTRLVESSWVDLKSSKTNFFSTTGDVGLKRRFYMNHVYNGCSGDSGWLVVKDETDDCGYAKPSGVKYPLILYSPSFSLVQYQSAAIDRADSLAVWVKLSGVNSLKAVCQN